MPLTGYDPLPESLLLKYVQLGEVVECRIRVGRVTRPSSEVNWNHFLLQRDDLTDT